MLIHLLIENTGLHVAIQFFSGQRTSFFGIPQWQVLYCRPICFQHTPRSQVLHWFLIVALLYSQIAQWESGLTTYWFATYFVPIDACRFGKDPPRSANDPLNLIDLSSAFLLLAFGIGLSLIVFLVEHIVSVVGLHDKDRRNNQVVLNRIY